MMRSTELTRTSEEAAAIVVATPSAVRACAIIGTWVTDTGLKWAIVALAVVAARAINVNITAPVQEKRDPPVRPRQIQHGIVVAVILAHSDRLILLREGQHVLRVVGIAAADLGCKRAQLSFGDLCRQC
jgi:anti-sigma-K factor RskA